MAERRVERRMAAILAADVAGYSRLMGQDEEGTLARLKAHRRELVNPKIHEHRGRIVKTTGDGLLVEFASPVEAVRCAVEVQRGMVDRNAATPEDKRIRFRVGINLGDVIADDGDLFGDGVNVAARLEALSEPGGLCISQIVWEQVRDKLPYAFEDMGECEVKNIARPVRVFALSAQAVAGLPNLDVAPPAARVLSVHASVLAAAAAGLVLLAGGVALLWPRSEPPSLAASTAAAPTAARSAQLPRLSIVVLPFANLSADPEQEHFADGVTEDLTSDLSRISGSFVIARNTAFTYKGIRRLHPDLPGHDPRCAAGREGLHPRAIALAARLRPRKPAQPGARCSPSHRDRLPLAVRGHGDRLPGFGRARALSRTAPHLD
jgi:adenylate cyclase